MKVYFIIIIALIVISESHAHGQQGHHGHHEHNNTKTFLIKTDLSKEELLTLLQNGEKQLSNLRKKEEAEAENTTNVTNTTVEEVEDTHKAEKELQEQIEDEIMDDALKPLDEFHVRQIKNSEVKSFVAKNDAKFIDSLYEKRFGKFYALLTLFFSVLAIIYFIQLSNNRKTSLKRTYIDYYDFDLSRECMIEKNN
jgi:hypothetical protein